MASHMNTLFKKSFFSFILGLSALVAFTMSAQAGEPVAWGIGFQEAATSSADRIHDFHDMLLYIIVGITLFVLVLLIIVVMRFNAKSNPTPSKVTHNVLLEVVWTVIPVVILIVIAVPSFKVLYKNDRIVNPEMTLKVRGYQWYWGYEYPDHGGIAFNSYMVPTENLRPDQKRLLSTDNVIVLPIDTDIALLTTAEDVIHSWTIPAFGVKMDAVPGHTNETWFNIKKTGVYYGQCSEICGKDHAYMPIEVHAVTKAEFEAWVVSAKEEFAALPVESRDNSEALRVTTLQQ